MPELEKIRISGFKSIASVEVKLKAINVVIGANGSGKSNFIGVFSFLNAIRAGRLQDYVLKSGGADRLLHFGSKKTPKMDVHVTFLNEENQYEIELEATELDELVPIKEMIYMWRKDRYATPWSSNLARIGKEAGISEQPSNSLSVHALVRRHLGSWLLYHFHDTSASSPMKTTADINDNRYLRPDGKNLAAFLYFLREKHSASYNLIRRTVQRVAPFFDDFQLLPQELNPEKIRLEWRHRNSEAYFDASSLSDGTLRFIALATLFLQPEAYRPSVILVDEPELGLHPYAITMLAQIVKQVAVKTQVIMSTQSPLLLDHFEPEDVLVTNLVDGATQFTRLDSNALTNWLEDFSLGQLWEKNQFGGRPGGQ